MLSGVKNLVEMELEDVSKGQTNFWQNYYFSAVHYTQAVPSVW